MISFGPREIIVQIVDRCLETVAVGETLIETEESVPFLVGVAKDARTLTGKSPTERIGEGVAQNRCVAHGKTLAVVRQSLYGCRSRQEGGLRVVQILQVSAPEDGVLPVRTQLVIDFRDEGVVIQLHRRAETEAGIIKPVSHRAVVGLKRPIGRVEVAEHGRIGPQPQRINIRDLRHRRIVGQREKSGWNRIGGSAEAVDAPAGT